jgi:hypothetical protein
MYHECKPCNLAFAYPGRLRDHRVDEHGWAGTPRTTRVKAKAGKKGQSMGKVLSRRNNSKKPITKSKYEYEDSMMVTATATLLASVARPLVCSNSDFDAALLLLNIGRAHVIT